MDNIMSLTGRDLSTVLAAMTRAERDGDDFHLVTGENKGRPWVKFKVGYGMWSAPLYCKRYDQ